MWYWLLTPTSSETRSKHPVICSSAMAARSSSVVHPVLATIRGSAMHIPVARKAAASCAGQRSAGATRSPIVFESPSARKVTGAVVMLGMAWLLLREKGRADAIESRAIPSVKRCPIALKHGGGVLHGGCFRYLRGEVNFCLPDASNRKSCVNKS